MSTLEASALISGSGAGQAGGSVGGWGGSETEGRMLGKVPIPGRRTGFSTSPRFYQDILASVRSAVSLRAERWMGARTQSYGRIIKLYTDFIVWQDALGCKTRLCDNPGVNNLRVSHPGTATGTYSRSWCRAERWRHTVASCLLTRG